MSLIADEAIANSNLKSSQSGRLAQALETPWKLQLEVRRLLCLPVARAYFFTHGVKWGKGWRIFGLPLIQRHMGSRIEIGDKLQMRNWFAANPLGLNHRCVLATWAREAEIVLGNALGVSGATICAQSTIRIGDRVRLGANTIISDTDFHPVSSTERMVSPKAGKARPISIEDDVFVGMNVIILKGVTIGRGSVIGAGSIVSADIPSGVAAAGNPARPIKDLD